MNTKLAYVMVNIVYAMIGDSYRKEILMIAKGIMFQMLGLVHI